MSIKKMFLSQHFIYRCIHCTQSLFIENKKKENSIVRCFKVKYIKKKLCSWFWWENVTMWFFSLLFFQHLFCCFFFFSFSFFYIFFQFLLSWWWNLCQLILLLLLQQIFYGENGILSFTLDFKLCIHCCCNKY